MRHVFLILTIGVVLAGTTGAAARAEQTPSARAPMLPPEYVFPSGAGLLLFHVHVDKTADFESVITRLIEVLDKTGDETRRRQAATWRIFRSLEAPRGAAIYLFFFDPAVPSADYDPVRALSDGVPGEVQVLYERLRAATIRVERMGLTKLR
jgi:hypothetical protein